MKSRSEARLQGEGRGFGALSILRCWLGAAPRTAHAAAAPDQTASEIENLSHFLKKQETLARLVSEFGYDVCKVTLSPQTKIFDYLGQSFTSEGQSFADGCIEIYYDPQMSDARLGCCLAHEL